MKTKFPLALLIIMGVLGITSRFLPHPGAETFHSYLRDTLLRIISAFALILGLGNLILRHSEKIRRREEGFFHSYVLLISLTLTGLIGLLGGTSGHGLIPTSIGGFSFDVNTLYNKIMIPLGASMFSLLAFYMASAAYRSFRAKNTLAVLLLGSAFIVMIGQVPIGQAISKHFPEISHWIMTVPNTAAKRGIDLGITLGITATLLKILAGIERSWLGGGA